MLIFCQLQTKELIWGKEHSLRGKNYSKNQRNECTNIRRSAVSLQYLAYMYFYVWFYPTRVSTNVYGIFCGTPSSPDSLTPFHFRPLPCASKSIEFPDEMERHRKIMKSLKRKAVSFAILLPRQKTRNNDVSSQVKSKASWLEHSTMQGFNIGHC